MSDWLCLISFRFLRWMERKPLGFYLKMMKLDVKIKDRFLMGTGYNTWGLANGVLAGKIMTDLIVKKKNVYIFIRCFRATNCCILFYLSVYNIIFFCSYQCLVKLLELEPISQKVKRAHFSSQLPFGLI